METTRIDYRHLQKVSEQLKPIRTALYHADGPGFYLFRGFLSSPLAEDIGNFWETLNPFSYHRRFIHRQCFHIRCPNVRQGPTDRGDVQYYNFFWNVPPDEETQLLAHEIQLLRSRLEGRQLLHELYPAPATTTLFGYSTCYRISINKHGDTIVPPHRDWVDKPANDPLRLQATLVLSKLGDDYIGSGFSFETNQGHTMILGEDIEAIPGDLLLWRYNNRHQVSNIRPGPTGRGFMRATFPTVCVYGKRSVLKETYWRIRTGQLFPRTGQWLLKKVRPYYRMARGLTAEPQDAWNPMRYN
jgi:hypothetical protein